MTRAIAALIIFGVSFGYVEASVVAYLRAIYDPLRQRLHPERPPGDLFPLITLQQLAESGPDNVRRLGIELGREAATLLMLASVGLAVSRNVRQGVAATLVAFGVWDISFYAFLRLLIHWPQSLFTWDILFLLPVPWVGPVIAPMLVSLSMIVCGIVALRRSVHLHVWHWAAILGGGLLVIVACCWDFRNTTAGGLPNAFNWPLFFTGEVIGVGGFSAARYASRE